MGIHTFSFSLLVDLKSSFPSLGGSILQLGRQDVHLTGKKAAQVFRDFGLRPAAELVPSDQALDDQTVFRSLGFQKVESVDFSEYEHPTWTHDLNHPAPPQRHGRYDMVFDGGTLEHIFDVPEALRNTARFLKEGGFVAHLSPCNNWFEHGFYSFNPALFCEYYQSCGFQILKSALVEFRIMSNRCRVYHYHPETAPYGLPGRGPLMVWFVARKLSDGCTPVTPQQKIFRLKWETFESPDPVNPHGKAPVGISLRDRIRKQPRLVALLLPLARWVGLATRRLPKVAEYDLF